MLLLELYVCVGCPQLAGQGELQAEAHEVVLSWCNQLVGKKGRVADASARDARGLILLMAAFGVPVEFQHWSFTSCTMLVAAWPAPRCSNTPSSL